MIHVKEMIKGCRKSRKLGQQERASNETLPPLVSAMEMVNPGEGKK